MPLQKGPSAISREWPNKISFKQFLVLKIQYCTFKKKISYLVTVKHLLSSHQMWTQIQPKINRNSKDIHSEKKTSHSTDFYPSNFILWLRNMKTKLTFKKAGLKWEKRKFPGTTGYTCLWQGQFGNSRGFINYLKSSKICNLKTNVRSMDRKYQGK